MSALSPDSRHKARQIREISRQLHHDNSVASSTGSQHGTVSPDSTQSTDFDPIRDDAQGSTGLIEQINANLPRLRDTARKYNRWAPRRSDEPAPTFELNTSAINDAFPGFDCGPLEYDSSSPEVSLNVGPIELGRGVKSTQQQQPRVPARAPLTEFSSNIDTQTIDTINSGTVQVAYTPTGRPRKGSQERRPRNLSNLEKSARWFDQNLRPNSPTNPTIVIPDVPVAQVEPQSSPFITTPSENIAPARSNGVPGHQQSTASASNTDDVFERYIKTKVASKKETSPKPFNGAPYTPYAGHLVENERRKFSDFQASVANESDTSILSQRPSNVIENKNTRFSKNRAVSATSTQPEKRSSLFEDVRDSTNTSTGQLEDQKMGFRDTQAKSNSAANKTGYQTKLAESQTASRPKTSMGLNATVDSPRSTSIQVKRNDLTNKTGLKSNLANSQTVPRAKTYPGLNPLFDSASNTTNMSVQAHGRNDTGTVNNTTSNQTQLSFALPTQLNEVSKLVLQDAQKSGGQVKLTKGRSFSADQTNKVTRGKIQELVENLDQEEEVDIYHQCQQLQYRLDTLLELRHSDQMLIHDLKNDRVSLETELEALEREKENGFGKDSGIGGVGSLSSHDGIRDIHISEICQQKDKLETEVKQFREKLAENRVASSDMEARLETRISKREAELAKLTEERDETRFRLETAVRQLERALQDVDNLNRDNQELLSTNDSLHQNIANLEQHVSILKGEVSKALIENGQLKVEHRGFVAERVAFNTEKSAWAAEKETMTREMESVREDLAANREEMSHFKNEFKECSQIWQQKSREWVTRERTLVKKIQRQNTAIRLCKDVKQTLPQKGQANIEYNNHEDSFSSQSDVDAADVTHESNFSDVFGHGFMSELYAQRNAIEEQRKQQESQIPQKKKAQKSERSFQYVDDDTAMTTGSRRSARFAKDETLKSNASVHSVRSNRDEPQEEDEEEIQSPVSVRSTHSGRIYEDETFRSVGSARSARSNRSTRSTRDAQAEAVRPGILKKGNQPRTPEKSRRRQHMDDDLTSAFIIPDIVGLAKEDAHPVLSRSARGVLDDLCKHNAKNCTVCTRVAIYDSKTDSQALAQIQIDKAVPVSKRMPQAEPYEEEPTLRPSVAPDFALDSVIKATKDELEHLKAKHVKLLNRYNAADASLGKRARKELIAELKEVSIARDAKEDMLYSLYDVLEGRKSDLDEELPWEGIEETE
ncbi:hypothetical protein BP6252_07343 [Coleophoma cylindrospora]|uniref:Cep57 centrosome microtubule-binding domain-containing protein n=1 Tax=Coleophoma cylindrospora TaxID=1849047 RepID=A0A3D8RHK7_9HELO|nr:hypothetical protein BP6252_07343 [Coleophoma cylindrospora]